MFVVTVKKDGGVMTADDNGANTIADHLTKQVTMIVKTFHMT